jgi:peptidyl-prolyl cis-trans isomerase SurA
MLKRVRVAVVAGAALLAAAGARGQVIEQVLVNVNGDIITLSDFEARGLEALRGRQDLARVSPTSPEFAKAVAEVAPQLILGAVDELLWMQRGREQGISLTPEAVNRILADIRKQNGLESEEAFRKALQAEGLSEADLRRNIERGLLIQEAQRTDVFEKISVNDDELRAFYETHKGQFTTPSEITLREILVAVNATEKGVNVAEDEAARAKAADIRKRLLAGEPFPRLAAELSDSGTKANGGLLGPLRAEDLAPALHKAFENLKVGDITDVVPTSRGYHIFKLESRSDVKVMPLEEVRTQVSRRVAEQKSEGELNRALERLRSQAKITWRHEELRKAYEQALAERRAKAGAAKS